MAEGAADTAHRNVRTNINPVAGLQLSKIATSNDVAIFESCNRSPLLKIEWPPAVCPRPRNLKSSSALGRIPHQLPRHLTRDNGAA